MIIAAKNLTKIFKNIVALDKLNFEMEKGTLTALIGAGKSTFIRLIAGLIAPTAGELQVLGLTENMTLYANLHGVKKEIRRGRFTKLLEMTGLERFTSRLAGKLSGGMKQKLGLACTLVRSPELLLLDEPTVGVDPLSRRELWEIIKKLVAEENLSVLVSTAYMDKAQLCEKVFVVNRGKILMSGSPNDIKSVAKRRCFRVKTPKNFL